MLREIWTASCPLCPRKRISISAVSMSGKCQKRASIFVRTHQLAGLEAIDPAKSCACISSWRRCVVSENVVAILRRLMAGEAFFVQRLVARLAVREVGESPAAGRGVLF